MRAGGIAKEHFGCLQRLQWTRAARTDRGVHAVCNVVSLKLSLGPVDFSEARSEEEDPGSGAAKTPRCEPPQGEELQAWQKKRLSDFLQRLNAELPQDILCLDARRVGKNFDARWALALALVFCLDNHGNWLQGGAPSPAKERQASFEGPSVYGASVSQIPCTPLGRLAFVCQMHFRVNCSRRRYEYVLPVWLLQPVAVRKDLLRKYRAFMLAEDGASDKDSATDAAKVALQEDRTFGESGEAEPGVHLRDEAPPVCSHFSREELKEAFPERPKQLSPEQAVVRSSDAFERRRILLSQIDLDLRPRTKGQFLPQRFKPVLCAS